ncbi:hypothetical protein SAMN05444921_1364 [Streptomyces wuyuanensis]|uniref:Uncharacterized protein n=1 Tax=Streptomyces wuyuanensis TaxID=1196353 RepID=A0A1H0DSC4_9ACTN|nr:hypothetical protein SAMN05444921_1364 [Streptomyces wuyuanensis]
MSMVQRPLGDGGECLAGSCAGLSGGAICCLTRFVIGGLGVGGFAACGLGCLGGCRDRAVVTLDQCCFVGCGAVVLCRGLPSSGELLKTGAVMGERYTGAGVEDTVGD